MTNEQLATLLSSYIRELETRIDIVREQLPKDMRRAEMWWNRITDEVVAPGWVSPMTLGIGGGPPENCELRPTGDFVALNELTDFVKCLEDDIERLRNESKN